jgi:hypothetical protein
VLKGQALSGRSATPDKPPRARLQARDGRNITQSSQQISATRASSCQAR